MRGVLAQEIHHRVKNNLQTVASLLRLQARATDAVDPRKALEDSVNRILAIAAVHEVLTERRDDDVDCSTTCSTGCARCSSRGSAPGKRGRARRCEPVALAGYRATALALVFSELLQNALEHGGEDVRIELARRDGDVVLAIADDGRRPRRTARTARASRSCARSSATSSKGRFELSSADGTRAEVAFPA